MIDEPDDLALRNPRRLDETIDRLADAVADLFAGVRGFKSPLAGIMQDEAAQDGALAPIKVRLDRIERRLDPQEPRP